MGRKRWWAGGLGLLVLCILHHGVLADGDVGCLFSKNVCDPQTETCFNDLAFGRCVSLYANLENDDLYQYNLGVGELELLGLQLEGLESRGYEWTHPFTQCIIQTSLHNLRQGRSDLHNLHLCEYLKKTSLDEQDDEQFIGKIIPTVAILRISADNENPESNLVHALRGSAKVEDKYEVLPVFYDGEQSPAYNRESAGRVYGTGYMKWPVNDKNDPSINDEKYKEFYAKLRDERSALNLADEEFYPRARRYSFIDYRNDDDIDPFENSLRDEKLSENDDENPYDVQLLSPELEFLPGEKSPDYMLLNPSSTDDESDEKYEKAFSRKYKPRKLPSFEFLDTAGATSLDNVKKTIIRRDENLDYEDGGANEENSAEMENLSDDDDASSKVNGMYTEGGIIRPSKHETELDGISYDDTINDDLNKLLWRRELAGFKRRERLDVKKPGPPFSTNNYAFKTQSPPTFVDEEDYSEDNEDNNEVYAPLTKKELRGNMYKANDGPPKTYKNVDLDYVYIEFEQEFHKWLEGEHVVAKVGELLDLPPGTLKDIRVGRAEVTFKVVPNFKNYNATDVAENIGNIRGKLKETLGVKVIRAGIGDKTKLPATLVVSREMEMNSTLFGALVAAGVAAAIAAAAVTLIIARRHAKYRAKLARLTTPDPEASKDYQDLCRVRMQAKQPSEKAESSRITSLSRENESNNLPSNRSSTSSWGEEPTLSNMDISTGHMVLSYMEDHLKNKDRLDQEWAALCAYEADPSSTEIAEREMNVKQNRPGAALPYDHSRVVLNDLVNANNSDYINASTIKSTDHDPRNPAYIATQGPLPQTTNEFWQLVWEQGSVVIVMLTRLTEEGHAMCHRYWPEEGSELYHIYEVHLVSEHFWCDDYLVRSFYLKNLCTCETRTVTQFHFLSWPENSVPYSTKALLEFRRKVNKSYRGRSCPIVVHCSDGVGRTGTYCLIDMVLNRMTKGAKEIDIAATLEHIRDQRPNMVATKQQFEFVLMAVAEEVHAILKALPVASSEKCAAAAGNNSLPPAKTEQ
ncbi:receptor-type tyrosine-protein phosphatase N2 isoform X1 [Harpegnathos saltator]|uniref:receptor-type tyrosine-protein phosphatase N2 isoform X1 n=1 Tax=Harpegnathos saltator TaxID=610380 RepID=UPI00058B6BF4|nr:receptor-type tyrosine-protein phosphatase N2 isoform X1 [Harpegnathos saltator]XP_025155505.1 receptor-type tyrosine-protein phosphatase N2 isoform X1 [Harpegnathos saltator]